MVLVDGFQHLSLERDLNLLLIDVSDLIGLQKLLPYGRLREPLSGVRRATGVIFTRAGVPENLNLTKQILKNVVGAPVLSIVTSFKAKYLMAGNEEFVHDSSWLQGKRILMFSGIANAASFRNLVDRFDVKIVDELVFSDHKTYTPEILKNIHAQAERSHAQVLLTTEKDLVKVHPLWKYSQPVLALTLDLQFLDGQDKLEGQLSRIFQHVS